ncbi:HK97 gp10 family phage protein [Brevundimonas sp. S30B]|uniref:HK97-gp10 family putative phage morphogenesis protein n=1 Tax=unclassified Brevundimonas TaxID=2622653 RepID=UPI0010716539|nr:MULTISPECIES: HK97-gp10 family putative phage morphogenesis protein [unclassified Brevundimonas]QBX38668.1 HK97 gp10 family phage protein [Brevundimonas sp. MF30-B]TFW01259.1 HK97 gp10 family phage protein [Brevundimonas sp. S30B]
MKFSNRDHLRRRMKAIPAEVKKAARAQLRANAEELVETIKRFAPEEDGALRNSVRQQDVSTSTRIARRVQAGGALTTKPVRKSEKGAPTYDYALAQEFGTERMPANPFFWPAWRLLRRRMRSRMTRAARKAIQKATG